jgi:hypothetical protein
MQSQNEAASQIVQALDKLGFKVDKVAFKAFNFLGVEASIKISRQGCPETVSQTDDSRTEQLPQEGQLYGSSWASPLAL